jgi:hypothetical protein
MYPPKRAARASRPRLVRGPHGGAPLYAGRFIGHRAQDMRLTWCQVRQPPNLVVDEMMISFTHDVDPVVLPDIAPTGHGAFVPIVP